MKRKPRKELFKSFDPVGLSDSLAKDLGKIDLGENLGQISLSKKEKLFLHRFGPDELFSIMREVGMIEYLNSMGFHDFEIRIDTDESQINYMGLYHQEISPENLLIDLRLSESKFSPKKKFVDEKMGDPVYDMVVIEWLSSQNPSKEFSTERPQLPGQERPGLGVLDTASICFTLSQKMS